MEKLSYFAFQPDRPHLPAGQIAETTSLIRLLEKLSPVEVPDDILHRLKNVNDQVDIESTTGEKWRIIVVKKIEPRSQQ